jgi:hypothetical protein
MRDVIDAGFIGRPRKFQEDGEVVVATTSLTGADAVLSALASPTSCSALDQPDTIKQTIGIAD